MVGGYLGKKWQKNVVRNLWTFPCSPDPTINLETTNSNFHKLFKLLEQILQALFDITFSSQKI